MEWATLRPQLMKSKPACAAAMPGMFRFVLKFSGGGLIDDTLARVKAMATPTRQLGPDFFEVLTQDPRPPTGDQYLHLRHAMLLAAYTGPEKLLSPADARKLHSKDLKVQMSASNNLIFEVRKLVEPLGDPKGDFSRALTAFETEVVLITLQKTHKDVPTRDTVEQAACCFCDALQELGAARISTKWDSFRPAKREESSARKGGKIAPKAVFLSLSQNNL